MLFWILERRADPISGLYWQRKRFSGNCRTSGRKSIRPGGVSVVTGGRLMVGKKYHSTIRAGSGTQSLICYEVLTRQLS